MPQTIAFIAARGGSKSIPLKNIKDLNGQPLILWNIQELILVEDVDEIWVSTDSREIEETVSSIKSDKVHVYRRNTLNAQDASSTEDALLEFVQAKGLSLETILLVQATSPFTRAIHFNEALIEFKEGRFDSMLSVVASKRFYWSKEGIPVNYDFKNRPRRQDFDPYFLENGAFYINTASQIKTNNNRLSGRIGYYVMPEFTGIEIDEEVDWIMAEFLMREMDYRPTLVKKANIKLFASDVDGVLTDAGMYYSEKGDELKKFNTRDGKGFELLRKSGIKTAIITSEDTKIVSDRAKKLKVDYLYQGKEHGGKLAAIKEICEKEKIELSQVAYIGDDINCKEALMSVGLAACPNDAMVEIKSIPGVEILNQNGGQGCVREFIMKIIM